MRAPPVPVSPTAQRIVDPATGETRALFTTDPNQGALDHMMDSMGKLSRPLEQVHDYAEKQMEFEEKRQKLGAEPDKTPSLANL